VWFRVWTAMGAAASLYRAVVAGASGRCEESSMPWACIVIHELVSHCASHGSASVIFERVDTDPIKVHGYVAVCTKASMTLSIAV
jgi:hypothetical protein